MPKRRVTLSLNPLRNVVELLSRPTGRVGFWGIQQREGPDSFLHRDRPVRGKYAGV